jgi:hypothetical protein
LTTFTGYKGNGRTATAWQVSLSQTWVKLKLSAAPSSGAHYTELKNIMDLKSEGEMARYVLSLGGLTEEIKILDTQ